MPTTSVILEGTASLFNDPSKVTYTDAKMLPFLKLAYQELQLLLVNIGSQSRLDTSSESTLSANDTEMDPPDDLIAPIFLEERNVGSTSNADWLRLSQVTLLPNIQATSNLVHWAWNEQKFKFVGATQDREVRSKYYRDLDAIASTSFNIDIINASLYLSYKTASIYCLFPGGLPKRGQDLANQADKYWKMAANIEAKTKQGNPGRHLPYGHGRRMLGRIRGAI